MGFHIGPLFVRYYGVILMLGAVAAAVLSTYEAKRRNQNPELVWDGLTWVLIGGVLGARLWHIFTPPPSMVAQGLTTAYYLTHPLDALAIWHGGLGIPGGIIGGGLALYWFTRRNRLNFGMWIDIVAPGLALAQAIGRWGNYVNQELYGAPTDLPWGIYIDPQYRLPEFANVSYYHPTFLYESLWNLANMFLLLWLGRKFEDRLRTGHLFLIYLIVYPVGRFLIEFIRLDSSQVAGINANQTLMAIVALVSFVAFVYRQRKYVPDKGKRKRSRSKRDG